MNEHENSALLEFVADASLATTLAEYGATVHSATFEQGKGTVVADLSTTADVSTAVDAVRRRYPESKLVSKRERERSVQTDEEFQSRLEDALTERQRTTLEAAYYAGFFEWPRDSTGEDVAQSLDISATTFHEHVRASEKKLARTVVGDEELA